MSRTVAVGSVIGLSVTLTAQSVQRNELKVFGSIPERDTLESPDYNDYTLRVCVIGPAQSKRLAREGRSSDFNNEDLNGVV
jgi:hypothetical protein